MTTTVSRADLQLGDVLLSRGRGALSDGIVDADGGTYSHASLWCGEDVTEATLPQVRRLSLADALGRADYVDVFRHIDPAVDHGRVVAEAAGFVGRPYATLDLALSSVAIAVCSWMPGDWAELVALYGAGSVARMMRVLARTKDARAGRVTCTGLVSVSHRDAQAPIRVRLVGGRDVRGDAFVAAVSSLVQTTVVQPRAEAKSRGGLFDDAVVGDGGLDADLRWLQSLQPIAAQHAVNGADAEALRQQWFIDMGLAQSRNADGERIGDLSPDVLAKSTYVAGDDWPPGLVTPRQLETSPDLQHIGRITDVTA